MIGKNVVKTSLPGGPQLNRKEKKLFCFDSILVWSSSFSRCENEARTHQFSSEILAKTFLSFLLHSENKREKFAARNRAVRFNDFFSPQK